LGCNWCDFPESEKASREVLSLPMHPFLTEEDQAKIIDGLLASLPRA
jgi:UDP-2-acetamido-2-deoxy-ribo-hexuluronate aminotransferase